MAIHIVLGKLTDQGIKDVKNVPQRYDAFVKATEAMGGKMTGYFTMGEYDYISIVEGLSDEAVASSLLRLGSAGNSRTTTLKAFTKQEFEAMVKRLP